MSRSYRKHFWFATEGDRRNKKHANHRVRHRDVESGSEYKKHFNSRDIHCFYIYYENENDFVKQNSGYGQSEEELRKAFRKYFRSK